MYSPSYYNLLLGPATGSNNVLAFTQFPLEFTVCPAARMIFWKDKLSYSILYWKPFSSSLFPSTEHSRLHVAWFCCLSILIGENAIPLSVFQVLWFFIDLGTSHIPPSGLYNRHSLCLKVSSAPFHSCNKPRHRSLSQWIILAPWSNPTEVHPKAVLLLHPHHCDAQWLAG